MTCLTPRDAAAAAELRGKLRADDEQRRTNDALAALATQVAELAERVEALENTTT